MPSPADTPQLVAQHKEREYACAWADVWLTGLAFAELAALLGLSPAELQAACPLLLSAAQAERLAARVAGLSPREYDYTLFLPKAQPSQP